MNYYNEHDIKTAAWLRELINQGLIPQGHVDTRSIVDVRPDDLVPYTQCHFFAGIAGWSYALQLAGWPSDRPVWTGSCPCQPFSTAGKGLAQKDERHLWPVFFDLIRQCRPEHVFGEQVASAIGHGWLDGVSTDLEAEGYACGATVLGAHSKAAPHVRERLFWAAHTNSKFDLGTTVPQGGRKGSIPSIWESAQIFEAGQRGVDELVTRCVTQRVPAYTDAYGLLHGVPARVVRLRGYGNAIVPQVAAEFIQAFEEARTDQLTDWV